MLSEIILDVKNGKIKAIVSSKDGIQIPLSQLYPSSWDHIN